MVEWSGLLDVGEGCLELFEFDVDLFLGFLSLGHLDTTSEQWKQGERPKTDSLRLKSLDSFYVGVHVVCDRLEVFQEFLGLVDDGLIFHHRTIMSQVDGGGLRSILDIQALGLCVALAESLECGDGLWDGLHQRAGQMILDCGNLFRGPEKSICG